MPATIAAAGDTGEDFNAQLDAMANTALADPCTASNPREVTLEQIKTIYRQAFTGKM